MSSWINAISDENGLELVRRLVRNGADVNQTWFSSTCDEYQKNTPLLFALRKTNREIAETLINAGADVNVSDSNGWTPLHVALLGGCDVIELLIEKGANVDAANRSDYTPLHIAIKLNRLNIAETLIEAGADPNTRDNHYITPLEDALELGCNITELLIEKGARVNTVDSRSSSPLHIALRKNKRQIAGALISAGADVNATDYHGSTPLHVASRSGCAIIRLLIEKGAIVNSTDREGSTPLSIALEKNNEQIIETLIDSGADALEDCLHWAATNGHEHIIERLLDKGVIVNSKKGTKGTPLHKACENGHLNSVQLLLERGASVKKRNASRESPIDLAKEEGHQDVVELIKRWQSRKSFGTFVSSLLARNATKDNNLQKEIDDLARELADKENHCALLRREQETAALRVEDLLAKTDVSNDTEKLELKINMEAVRQNTNKIDCLHYQMEQMMTSIEELKAAKLSETNKSSMADEQETSSVKSVMTTSFKSMTDSFKKKSCFLEAVTAGDEDLVVRLLRKNPDLNMRDKDKQTPLFLACKYNRHDIIRLLVDRGADVNASNKENATPLYIASENGYADVVEYLLDHKADVHSPTRNDGSPLLIAADNGHLLVVEALLKKGARMNRAMKGGYTPLYVAARNDRREVVQMLLEHGADANASSDKGMSPLHRAAVEGYTEVMELLLEYGADVDTMNTQQDTADRLAEQHGKNVARDLIVCWRGMSQSERNSHTEMKRKEREEQKERLIQVSKCASSSDLVDLTVQLAAEEREMEELRDKARALNLALNTIPEEGDVSEVPLVEEIIQELVVRQERVSELRCGITKSQYVRNENVTKNFIIINQGVVHGTVVGNCRDIYVESQDNN